MDPTVLLLACRKDQPLVPPMRTWGWNWILQTNPMLPLSVFVLKGTVEKGIQGFLPVL